MKVLRNFTCINNVFFEVMVVQKKLGDNIVTATNNVLHTFLTIFAIVKFLPCFTIIADTGKLTENFCMTEVTFLHDFCRFFLYINMGTAFQLLYLIKILKMAAELCKGVFRKWLLISLQPTGIVHKDCNYIYIIEQNTT